MPKLKTSRAAAKRFKMTGTGKLVRNKAYKSQITAVSIQIFFQIHLSLRKFISRITQNIIA